MSFSFHRVYNPLKSIFKETDNRDRTIRINIIFIFLFRVLGLICGFLTVPVALEYLDKKDYGVWLTLTSVISWLSFTDIGLGHGLRNKLAEAVAKGDSLLSKELVSTAYIAFSLILAIFFVVFSSCASFFDWNSILKADESNQTLSLLVIVLVLLFCMRLLLDLVGIVTMSVERPFIKSLIDFLISAFTLLCIFVLTKVSNPQLFRYTILVALVPVVVLSISTLAIFSGGSKWRNFRPSIKSFRWFHVKSLFSIGSQFFIIQIASLIIFSTDNILITQFFSPEAVPNYNIALKYFSIVTIMFSIILTPYWSSFTHAFFNQEIHWIKSAIIKLSRLWFAQILLVILFFVFSGSMYRIWVGDSVKIPVSLDIALAIYTILANWNSIFAQFLNGIGKIKLQLALSVFISVVNIPLSVLFCRYTGLGVTGIIYANCLCLSIFAIVGPVQCAKIIRGKASGFWNV